MDYKIWYTEDSINCNERKVCFVKRKKFLARVLSLPLALLLCTGLLPGAALAAEGEVDYSKMTEKFAEDTWEAKTWPIYQDMENWNLRVSDEGRKYFQNSGWEYMLYPAFYKEVFMHGTLKDPYDAGVDIPRGATEVYADYYWMLTQHFEAGLNLVEDYENDKELLFDYLTMPFRYYFSTCGYAKRVYTDEYGLEEAVYSKGDDHFVIPSWKKAQAVKNESGVVYVVHFKCPVAAETTAHTFTGEQPSSWAKDQVGLAIDAGIVPQSLQSRYTDTTTRADFCALVVTLIEKYAGEELPTEEPFTDTDDLNVRKAAWLGIVQGVGNGAFNPDGELTREQAATMLERTYRASLRILQGNGTSGFADASSVSNWAADAVAKMENSGIMNGVGSNQFKPQDSYSREQSIMTMFRLYRLFLPAEGRPAYQEAAPTEVDAMGLAHIGLDYIYTRLKVPSSMEVLRICHGYYDRTGLSDAVFSDTDEYYAVSIMVKAMNSLGGMVTDSYVFLFNLTTGETEYDLIHRAEDNIDYAWGASKLNWMDILNEALQLAGGGQLNEFSREEVDELVRQVIEKHAS